MLHGTCKVFEAKLGAKTIATSPKYRPRTKHINIKYWHFMEHVEQGKIDTQSVKSEDQLANNLTKPLPEKEFVKLRDISMGERPSTDTSRGNVMNEAPDIDTTDSRGSVINKWKNATTVAQCARCRKVMREKPPHST